MVCPTGAGIHASMLKFLPHRYLLPPIGARTARRAIAAVTLGLAVVLGSTIEFGSIRRESSVCASDMLQSMDANYYAADQGNVVTQWRLAHMYATGKGLPRCDARAFEYFSRIADSRADEDPDSPQAAFVADAFMALGKFYLSGIRDTSVKSDLTRGLAMFTYAASYFRNADAQYQVGRMYLDGQGVPRDARRAARWFTLAANKGEAKAQAMLGHMLVKGDAVPRDPARGLMWLTLARDSAKLNDKWINEFYQNAFKQTNSDERARALMYLEDWLKSRAINRFTDGPVG
jgi:TPR repeat protein